MGLIRELERDWWDDAACGPAHFNPDVTRTIKDPIQLAKMRLQVFFPMGDTTPLKNRRSHVGTDPIYAQARAICQACPVRKTCLADAIASPPGEDDGGMRACTSCADRRKIRRQRPVNVSRPRPIQDITWKPARPT